MRRREWLKTMGAAAAGAGMNLGGARYAAAQTAGPDRYEPTWESLDKRSSPPWYADAKFGIFIHWGVYSVPAFAAPNVKNQNPYAEWYWNSLTVGKGATAPDAAGAATWEFHKRVYGADFPYANFAPLFRAELYDPDRWADLFSRSGARYVALTSKHHEGFALWRSAEANRSWGRPWNSVDVGPKRDVALDLMEAGRRKGLQMGIYYSLYEWYNPLWLGNKQRYVSEHLFPQFKDAVSHLKPAIIFSDGEWELTSAEWRSPELLAWLFNESPVKDSVVIDDRWGKDTRHKHGGYYTTEYTSGMQQSQHPWEESRGMGFSYGYNRAETLTDYHTDRELLMMLIDIVSRGGNLLLDIGPRSDGAIPVVMEERLVEMGSWLQPNGEAIYGTRPWDRPTQWSAGTRPQLEQSEFRAEYNISKMVDEPPAGFARVEAFFTAKNDAIYAIVPRWPGPEFALTNVNAPAGSKFSLLETGSELEWRAEGNQVVLKFPDALRTKMPARQAYVIKMQGVSNSGAA